MSENKLFVIVIVITVCGTWDEDGDSDCVHYVVITWLIEFMSVTEWQLNQIGDSKRNLMPAPWCAINVMNFYTIPI